HEVVAAAAAAGAGPNGRLLPQLVGVYCPLRPGRQETAPAGRQAPGGQPDDALKYAACSSGQEANSAVSSNHAEAGVELLSGRRIVGANGGSRLYLGERGAPHNTVIARPDFVAVFLVFKDVPFRPARVIRQLVLTRLPQESVHIKQTEIVGFLL